MEKAPQTDRLLQARSFVELGYGDMLADASFRSLDFLTDTLPTHEIQQLTRLVKSYNAFKGERVADALRTFDGRVCGWQFGRAGSPLLQVELAHWTHQVEGTPPGTKGTRFEETKHRALVEELRQTFVDELEADAFEATDDSWHIIRIWWD